jgi:hypothetical protein
MGKIEKVLIITTFVVFLGAVLVYVVLDLMKPIK